MRDIGINKQRMGVNLAFCIIFISIVLLCAIMWGVYQGNYENEYWINNGVEVEAECIGWFSDVDYIDMDRVIYYCEYRYVDANGKEYIAVRKFSNKENAQKQIGKKIKIVIDPNGNDVIHADLNALELTYERDLILAIIFCFPVPGVTYLLVYRGIYRSAMNYKIRKRVGEKEPYFTSGKRYNGNAIKVGEVTKVRKWIVCYVKVKYRDEKGVEREKWARSWFTHKEAKFLERKKFINIVPYKNTYGILEKMP